MTITNSMLNDDSKTSLELYYDIISQIESELLASGNPVIHIDFDNTNHIFFVHPLFLVYLLNFYEKLQVDEKYRFRDIRIILDIENLDSSVQSYIKTYLTQYIDCQVILVVDSTFRDRKKPPFTFTDKKILLYTTDKEENLTLLKKQPYKFLPIIKIANNTFNEDFDDKAYWITNKETNKPEKISRFDRKIFYQSLQLETIEKGAYKNKSDKVWTDIFETYLELTQNGAYITKKFKEIFREIVENIQKHTKIDYIPANGYISFYIDSSKKSCSNNLYKLIVSDDYQNGFLHKYYETIAREIEEEYKDSIAWKGYNDILIDFKNEKYKDILEKIFKLEYILSAQAERVTKHFGMPILLKIVRQLEYLSSCVNLTIYLNYHAKSFKVIYKDAIAEVYELVNNSVRGTHIYLSFPKELHLDLPQESEKEPLCLNTKKYSNIFSKQKDIYNTLSKFQSLNIEKIKNKEKIAQEKESLLVDYALNDYSISEFLRYIYSYAFIYSIKDILVINFPIEEELDYLLTLTESKHFHSFVNIAFLNISRPKALFLGGNNKDELYSANHILSQAYNYNKRNFVDPNSLYQVGNNVKLDSNLFYRDENQELNFIPFEIFLTSNKTKEYIYTQMLDSFLDEKDNYEDIHLDLKNGYHLDKFYYLKNIFENSQWINIIAFDLAREMNSFIEEINKENEKTSSKREIILVGIEKYSSMILSVVQNILDSSLNTYIIEDLKNTEIIKQFNKFVKTNKRHKFIFFRPVVFECCDTKHLLDDITNYELYCAIRLKTRRINSNNWKTLYLKDIEDIVLNPNKESKNCLYCFPSINNEGKQERDKEQEKKKFLDKPIYKIDDDKYNVKNLYKDNFVANKSKITSKINWKNSIYFGHTIRNTNHYLYYIRTVEFLKNNMKLIQKDFLKYTSLYDKNKIPIILSANHNTNSEFITLINKNIFEDNAIIHTFSLDYKEQVFYSLEHFRKIYSNKDDYYEFYFVDDEVASGDTLEYFFNILKQMTNKNDIQFKAVFTLIDRTSPKDKRNILSQYYGNLYSFIRLNIHPIKTGFEKCYLCKREEYLQEIADNSSLVFVKNAFMKKIHSNETSNATLEKRNSVDIEYELIGQINDFKNYLKMYATEYIYERLEKFSTIEQELKCFTVRVNKYFKNNYLNGNDIKNEIQIIINFEIKIAFLKSLSFPKILFFQNIRNVIHEYIYYELYEFIIDEHTKNVKTIENNFIESKLSFKDFEALSELEEIAEITYYHRYKDKTNIDYFNFLLLTASYLGINFIMSEQMIAFYFNLTQVIKDEDIQYKKYKKLLGAYPIAIKQITYYSEEKSRYFHEQLQSFYDKNKFQYTRQFSRIFGLYVENTKFLENDKKILHKKQGEQISLKDIKEIINNLEIFIKKEDNFGTKYDTSNINIKKFFININQDIKKPKLVDILNNYQEVETKSYVTELYRGAHIKDEVKFTDTIDIKHNQHKDPFNIWCNFLEKDKTYVRLTDRALNPLGVIVIEHKKTSQNLLVHLKISRRILAKQNEIIDIFKDNEFVSSVRDSVNILTENKSKLIKGSHGAAGDISNALTNINNEQELFINLWKAYCNTYIGNMYLDENQESHNICELNNEYTMNIKRLLQYINYLNQARSVKIDFNIDSNVISTFKMKNNYINIFFSLFIDNAIKHSDINRTIRLYNEVNMLIIENDNLLSENIDCMEINRNLIVEPYKISKNQGITLFTINKYLNSINCFLKTNCENGKFKIYIIKK